MSTPEKACPSDESDFLAHEKQPAQFLTTNPRGIRGFPCRSSCHQLSN